MTTDRPELKESNGLRAKESDGTYLLEIRGESEGYSVHSAYNGVSVETVTINGNYVSTTDWFETECDDFVIEDNTLNLIYEFGDGEHTDQLSGVLEQFAEDTRKTADEIESREYYSKTHANGVAIGLRWAANELESILEEQSNGSE